MSSGPGIRPTTPIKKAPKKPAPSQSSVTINVILDTKARREYPSALTHAEVKCPGGSTIKFILDALKEELGNAVPIAGIRRLKDSENFSEGTEVASALSPGETVVAYCADKPKSANKPKTPSPKVKSGASPSSRLSLGSRSGSKLRSNNVGSDNGSSGGPTPRSGSSAGGRPGSKDHLTRMSEAGRLKNASFREKEKKAAELKAAAEEAESKKFAFSPKTNVITKRKNEEKLAKEKAKQKAGGGLLATLLSSGGWVGELPLPNSYDQPAKVVAVFVVTAPEDEATLETKGVLRLLPHGDFAGPEGLVVKWSAWPQGSAHRRSSATAADDTSSVGSSRSYRSPSPFTLKKRSTSGVGSGLSKGKGAAAAVSQWDLDLFFPPSLCAAPVPTLLRSNSPTSIDIAFPLGEKDEGAGALNPSSLFGSEAPCVLRPTQVDWPNQILSLSLVGAEELSPPPPKDLKLGTSLKNVAMSILKEIKKLMVNALKAPSGRRLADGQKKAVVVVRLWNVRVEAKLDVDPFWSVAKLRVGLARLYARFPPLCSPAGEMCEPVWLAQAMEDEKDGRLRDRVVDTLEELVRDLDHCEVTYEDQGEHTPRINDDTEVFWFTGNSNVGLGSPLGAYLATLPDEPALRRLRVVKYVEDADRPARPCDVLPPSSLANPALAGAAGQQLTGLEGLEPGEGLAEKGTRGKLILAAERNKKALEDGTYGGNPGGLSYMSGQEVLGRGAAAAKVDPSTATVSSMRLLKLDMNGGRSLADEEFGSKAEAEAAALQAKRAQRSAVTDLGTLRAKRLKATANLAAIVRQERAEVASGKTTPAAMLAALSSPTGGAGGGGGASATLAAANKQAALIEMKMRRLQLAKAVELNATRKRSRPEEVAAEAKAEQNLLSGVKLITDPAEKRRLTERILAARKRKLMDFLPSAKGGGGRARQSAVDASAAEANSKMEAPLGGAGTKSGGKMGGKSGSPEMTEEEKEMLAILKGINTSSSDKFAESSAPSGGEEVMMTKERGKIKDPKKKGEIASMRLAVILGDTYASQLAANEKVTVPAPKRE